jgi:PAS domain S-box-containing protein
MPAPQQLQSEEVFPTTFLHEIQRVAKIGSWERDMETGVITWSPEARLIINAPDGITFDEYVQRYVHPDDRERVKQTIAHAIAHAIAQGLGYEVEYRIITDEGIQKTLRVSTIMQQDTDERGKHVRGIIQDISSWKAAQDELAEQRQLLRESQYIAKIGGWEFDVVLNSVIWTDEYYNIIERKREEFPPTIENYYLHIHPNDRQRVYDEMLAARSGSSDALEYRIILPNGNVNYVRGYGSVLRDEQDNVLKLRGVIQDISDSKRNERQLRRLTEVLNQAQHLTHLGSWEHDLRSGELTWSDEFFRQLGYEPQQFPPDAEDFFQKVHPDDRERVRTVIRALAVNNTDYEKDRFIEYRVVRPDGDVRYMRGTGGSVMNVSGNVRVIFGTLQDITQMKEAQMRLEASEDKFRRLFEQSSIGQIMYDGELRPMQANTALLGMLGYSAQEFLSLPYFDIIHPEDRHKFNEQMQALWLGNIPSMQADIRFLSKSKVVIWARIKSSVSQHSANVADSERYILLAAEDITQYRQVEDAIQKTLHRERELFDLRTQMVSRLSHQLQTPLSAIMLATGIMQKHYERMPPEKIATYLGNIVEATEEVQSLMSNMVLMGKLETGRVQLSLSPLNIPTFCKRLLGEFTAKYMHRPVESSIHLPDGAITLADHELLRLIVWHLLLFLDKGLPRGAALQFNLTGEYDAVTQSIHGMKWYVGCSAEESKYTDIAELLSSEQTDKEAHAEVGLPTIQQAVKLYGGTLTGSNNGKQITLLLSLPALG